MVTTHKGRVSCIIDVYFWPLENRQEVKTFSRAYFKSVSHLSQTLRESEKFGFFANGFNDGEMEFIPSHAIQHIIARDLQDDEKEDNEE